jgi:hypothetical protein
VAARLAKWCQSATETLEVDQLARAPAPARVETHENWLEMQGCLDMGEAREPKKEILRMAGLTPNDLPCG